MLDQMNPLIRKIVPPLLFILASGVLPRIALIVDIPVAMVVNISHDIALFGRAGKLFERVKQYKPHLLLIVHDLPSCS